MHTYTHRPFNVAGGEKYFNEISNIDDIWGYVDNVVVPYALENPEREGSGSRRYYVNQNNKMLGGMHART